MSRDYEALCRSLAGIEGDRAARMRRVVDALWEALHPTGVSWAGFYLHEGGEELTLGPMRDKPACSPIGMHGACGQAFTSGKPLVVRDVKDLGDNYVACDPRDQAEVVVPVLDESGKPWGVLDLDSFDVGSFTEADAAGLVKVLKVAGLTR